MDYDHDGEDLPEPARGVGYCRNCAAGPNDAGAPTATGPKQPFAAYSRGTSFSKTYRAFATQQEAEAHATDLIRKGQKEVIITKFIAVIRPRVEIEIERTD